MPCNPQIQFADPPAGSCIPQELVQYLRDSTSILNPCNPEGQVGIVVSNVPPGVDDTDLIWLKTDAFGAPLYFLMYYSGTWRRIGGCPIGTKVYYSGPITGVFDPSTLEGLRGGEWDGWIIRHSDDNKFIINGESYNGSAWVSSVTGAVLTTGGSATSQSDASNTYWPARAAVTVYEWKADGNGSLAGGGLYGKAPGTAATLLAADPGNLTPPTTTNVPPFVAAALVEYLGVH